MVSPFEEFGDKNGVCIHFPGSDGDGLSRRSYGIPFLFSHSQVEGPGIGKFAEVAFCKALRVQFYDNVSSFQFFGSRRTGINVLDDGKTFVTVLESPVSKPVAISFPCSCHFFHKSVGIISDQGPFVFGRKEGLEIFFRVFF